MPTVDATPGSITANSYVTVAEANSYFDGSYGRPLWTAASEDEKASLVISASRYLDQMMTWIGTPTNPEQSMWWPCDNAVIGNMTLSKISIPVKIKIAVFELAYFMLESGAALSFTDQTIDSVKVGTIRVEFTKNSTDAGLPTFVEAMLGGFGSPVLYGSNAARSIDLVRA